MEKQLKTLATKEIQKESPKEFTIAGVKEIRSDTVKVLAYVTELQPEGFIIISADTDINPVLGYSFKGKFALEESQQNVLLHLVQWDVEARLKVLSSDANEVSALVKSSNLLWSSYDSSDGELIADLSSAAQWGPLLDTHWHQGPHYNNRCPLLQTGGSTRCAVGCVATSIAQILNYWLFPPTVQFSNLWFPQGDAYSFISRYGAGHITIDGDAIPRDFPSFTVDRPGMPSLNTKLWNINYNSNPDEEAYLCFAAGVKVQMNYGTQSGAWVWGNDYRSDLSYASARTIYPSEPDFYAEIQQDIKRGRPVQLIIWDKLTDPTRWSGHSVIVDGYKDSGEYQYHINFGWGYSYDLWYSLPPGNVGGYNWNVVEFAIIEIDPKSAWPSVSADSRNTSRIDYEGPEGYLERWIVRTSDLDSSTRLAAVIVAYGGKVFALCEPRSAVNPGRLFVISPYGVVEKSIEISPWPWSTRISWPVQASTPGLPIYFASGNRLFRFTLTGQLELCWQDQSDNLGFFYPTQVDGDGNIYITGNRKMASISPSGGLRWYKTRPASANFSAGVAIDDERDRLYAKYYEPDNDTAYLWALNKDTGAEAWNIPVPAVPNNIEASGEPTVGEDGTIYAIFYNSLRAYNPDGTLKWEYKVDASKEALEGFISLGMYDNIYIGGNNFVDKYAWLRSIKTSDEPPLWEFTRPYLSPDVDYVFLRPPVAAENKMLYTTLAETASPGYRRIYALRDNGFSYTKLWDYEGADWTLLGSCREALLLDWHGERIIALSGGKRGDPDSGGMGFVNNKPPNQPSNPTPSNGSENLGPSVVLSWNCSDPEAHDVNYAVYIGASEVLGLYAKDLKEPQCTVTSLHPGTSYMWKVVATDGQAVSEGDTWVFSTRPPNPNLYGGPIVNFPDFAVLTKHWLEACSGPGWCEGADLDWSGKVDYYDLSIFADHWLEGTMP